MMKKTGEKKCLRCGCVMTAQEHNVDPDLCNNCAKEEKEDGE